jgi:hypothetical protein
MSAWSMKFFTWDLKVEIEKILTNFNTKSSKCQRRAFLQSCLAGLWELHRDPWSWDVVHRTTGQALQKLKPCTTCHQADPTMTSPKVS